MTKHEKIALLVLLLLFAGRVGGLVRDVYLLQTYGATIPPDVLSMWEQLSIFIGGLVNFGAAVWVFFECKSLRLKLWVWPLFSLAFGLTGVVLFYLVQLFQQSNSENA